MNHIALPMHISPIAQYFEFLFIILIVLSCLTIYYLTRELYALTEHKGIKYFRKGFLFIGLAHILMLLTQNIIPHTFALGIGFQHFSQMIFGLFNFIGLGFLLASLFPEKIKEWQLYMWGICLILFGIIFAPFIFFIYTTILIFGIGIISFLKIRERKIKKNKVFSHMYLMYLILSLGNIFLLIFGHEITEELNLGRWFTEFVLAGIFMYILYLVIKKLK